MSETAVAPSLTLTVEEAGKELRLTRSPTWELIKSGKLPSVLIGGSRRVRRADLEAYLAALVPSLPGESRAA